MARRAQDAIFGAGLGLVCGLGFGLIAAGAFVTWRWGGDPAEVGLLTYPQLFPGFEAAQQGAYATGGLIGLGVALACMVGGVALTWRRQLSAYGTARWADASELRRAGLLVRRAKTVRGPIWGKLGRPRASAPYLSSEGIVHSLVTAPTGAGKGVGVVIPTLLTYVGSAVVLDVKGENFEKTARRRHELGDRVFRFAPYDKDRRSHRYNPFDEIAAAPERRRFREALRLAGSLLETKGKGAEDWIGGAREIFAAAAIVAAERETPTIAAVYDLLSAEGEAGDVLADLAEVTKSGEARSVFNRYAAQPAKVLGSYMSVMFGAGLRLWADPDVRDATAATDFWITDFRADPACVFICVSQKDISILSPLIRLMFQQMFTLLQETDRTEADKFDVLFLLDEFASLGRMEEMGRAITTVRSSGAHLMLIVQSLAGLREIYGADGAANFMGNCELQLFMAPTDADTPRYVSEAIGDATRWSRVKSRQQRGFDAGTITERQEGARLIRPEQIRLLGPDDAIALVRDQNPIRCKKVRYFEDRGLRQIYERQTGAAPQPPEMPQAPRAIEQQGSIGVVVAAQLDTLVRARAGDPQGQDAGSVPADAGSKGAPGHPPAPPVDSASGLQLRRPRAVVPEAVQGADPKAEAGPELLGIRTASRELDEGVLAFRSDELGS